MKKVTCLYKVLPLLFALMGLDACEENADIDPVDERLELTASSARITLDANRLTDDILTFAWTEARPLSDDYLVSYTTKLDVVGNNFGSSTTILSYEDEGVFSRSFTSEQLQNWANEKWMIKVNKPFTLEFRVVSQWEGGSTFEAPEVRTVTVEVEPIRVEVFGADKMFVGGSAVPDGNPVEIRKTVENESRYAWYGALVAGELQVPVELEGETYYLVPHDGNGTIWSGEAVRVKMQETPGAWNIETDGDYRIVIDMEKTTATLYTPDQPLEPAVVTWMLDGVEQTTTVTNLWHYGEPTGWSWKTGNWTQSMADPQVFIYSGPALSGRTKFGVYPHNQSYVYTGNNTAKDTQVAFGSVYTLYSGYSANERNAYFKLPAGTDYIILDLRNKTMEAFKK
ncbi:MAG: SusE domain-containing protein [Parabacteroides sp.]|nr:SusE domain-containing protein [Parabacteroides sp.]